jgi:hypothetical protein
MEAEAGLEAGNLHGLLLLKLSAAPEHSGPTSKDINDAHEVHQVNS